MTLQHLIVASSCRVADEVIAYTLRAPDGAPLAPFTAGAHLDVHLSNGMVRQYSLCNDPADTDTYHIAIQCEPQGRGGSRHAHAVLQPGSPITTGLPRNAFALAPAPYILLLAGGIGITPLMSMAAHLHRTQVPFTLHHGARHAGRLAFAQQLQQTAFADRVAHHCDDHNPLDVAAVLRAAPTGSHLYTCGPAGFMDHVRHTARSQGWHDERLHSESFSAPAPVAGSGFAVRWAPTGQHIAVAEDQSVAEALQHAGIAVGLSCEQGICGACVVRVLDGEPEHHDLVLSADDHALERLFTPCCSRARSAELVLAPR